MADPGAGSRPSLTKVACCAHPRLGVVSFGRKNLSFVAEYVPKQKEHHAKGTPLKRGWKAPPETTFPAGRRKDRQGLVRMAKAPDREARLKPA